MNQNKKNQENINLRNCRFGYQCTQDYDKLKETNDKDIKFCRQCAQNVYMVHSDKELIKVINENKCIAFIRPNESNVLLGLPSFRNGDEF